MEAKVYKCSLRVGLWFCLAGFDLFIHSVRATVCERGSLLVVRLKKRGKRFFFLFFFQPLGTTTTVQLILGSLSGGQNRNLVLSFCSGSRRCPSPRTFVFASVQCSSASSGQGFQIPGSQNQTESVSVFLTLSSTASHSCPSPRSTPGSCRRSGSSRWSHDCCGRCRDGSEPGAFKKRKTTKFDNLLSVSRVFWAGCVCFVCGIVPWTGNTGMRTDAPSRSHLQWPAGLCRDSCRRRWRQCHLNRRATSLSRGQRETATGQELAV